MELNGKIALVTGASRGIGRAIAIRLAAAGAHVVVHYGSNAAAAEQTVASIRSAGGTAFPLRAEFGPDDAIDELAVALTGILRAETGQEYLDILVNNAAVVSFSDLEKLTPEEFDTIVAVNVKTPLFLIKKLLPIIRDNGRIVSLSTLATRTSPPAVGYVMSKGAIDVMGRTLASALGHRGITVNTVAPGVIATDVFTGILADPQIRANVATATALGRLGEAADIADVVAFLASQEARWITGQVIDVSGGLALRPRTFG